MLGDLSLQAVKPLKPESTFTAYLAGLSNQVVFIPMDDSQGSTRARVLNLSGIDSVPLTNVRTGTDGFAFDTSFFFSGTTSFINIYSVILNTAFNKNEATVNVFFKVNSLSTWSDGADRTMWILRNDAANYVNAAKFALANRKGVDARMSATIKQFIDNVAGTINWYMLTITWSQSLNEMRFFLNGIQVGVTVTGSIGLAGNLAAANTCIGASNSSGSNSWSGYMKYFQIFNVARTPAQILEMYTRSGL